MTLWNEEQQRAAGFKRNSELETLLYSINDLLGCSEQKALKSLAGGGRGHTIIFVMGPHRSGTTLFMQWLANSGVVAYPTNLLSRFFGAPIVGAHVQLLLTDPRYNFRNEILDFNQDILFESQNGKTTGALAPNEFWYFWRRFLPFTELDWLPDEELFRIVDKKTLVAELVGLAQLFDKPFALKSMILNYNIAFLDAIFEKALFVQIKRDPVTNVASVLEARKRQLGNEREWYSFKIPEYPQLKDLDPVTQSAGQVYFIDRAVTRGLAGVDESRRMVVQYEEFCKQPVRTFEQLAGKLELKDTQYRGPSTFSMTRDRQLSNRIQIERALAQYN